MHGILSIHKPSGVTSRDVVNRVQRMVRPHKVGHAGTLDPLASGVLVVCIGAATRLVEYVQQMPKRYTATFLLGCESDTEDVEGEVRPLADAPALPRAEIAAALPNFLGKISQRPPAYSALKVGGKRAYKLARAGKQVEVAPRIIEIHALKLRDFDYPRMTLEIVCGSGTYVRSLGRDIARSLRSGAVMERLERTAVGAFRIGDSVKPDALRPESLVRFLLPLEAAVAGLPRITLDAEEAGRLAAGQAIARPVTAAVRGEMAAFDPAGSLVAIVAQRGEGAVGPVKNLASQRRPIRG